MPVPIPDWMSDPPELGGLAESQVAWRLGPLSVDKERPVFRLDGVDLPGVLANTSWIRVDDGVDSCAAVFLARDPSEEALAPEHTAESGSAAAEPTAYCLGWVRTPAKPELEAWCAWMNGHIAELLHARQPKPEQGFPANFVVIDNIDLPPR